MKIMYINNHGGGFVILAISHAIGPLGCSFVGLLVKPINLASSM